jgi:hypothetical protein
VADRGVACGVAEEAGVKLHRQVRHDRPQRDLVSASIGQATVHPHRRPSTARREPGSRTDSPNGAQCAAPDRRPPGWLGRGTRRLATLRHGWLLAGQKQRVQAPAQLEELGAASGEPPQLGSEVVDVAAVGPSPARRCQREPRAIQQQSASRAGRLVSITGSSASAPAGYGAAASESASHSCHLSSIGCVLLAWKRSTRRIASVRESWSTCP